METLETDVLIVGAGPAGLTASSLLARDGIEALTFSKYGLADAPRAHITNQRAMEVFRDLGIEAEVAERALPQALMGEQVYATSFAGRELSRMMAWGTGADRAGEYQAASPCSMCNIGQHSLEPILLANARKLGADIRLNHEVVGIAQDDKGVSAVVRDKESNREFQVRAKYVVGCDGAKTLVGEAGEFEYEGTVGNGDAVTVWIEADLSKYTKHRSGALFFTVTPGSRDMVGVWTCVEPWNEWSTIFLRPGLAPLDLTPDAVNESIRLAIGDDDVDYKIKKVSSWQFNHLVAANYRRGRFFIAGDAAHRHPPANGLGSNTSIQDAYNLCWKLTMVIRGCADDSLLDSYSAERQPVGRQIVDRANQSANDMLAWFGALGLSPDMSDSEANARLEALYGPGGEAQREQLLEALKLTNEQFNALGVELGQYYRSQAIVSDGSCRKLTTDNPDLHYEASTSPGSPVPHAWLATNQADSEQFSPLDLCDYGQFTLITGASGQGWVEAAEKVSETLNVRIRPVQVSLGLEVNDVYGDWTHQREVTDAGCLLVRPDRFVAWRSQGPVDDPHTELLLAMQRILGV